MRHDALCALRQPDRAGICHCRMCQKSVGGPFTAWANVRMENFAWTRGEPARFRSSSAAERGFCARCGTPLFFAYVKRPGSISMSIGSLDTPGAVRLSEVDGIESRLANFDPSGARRPAATRTPARGASRGSDAHRDLSASGP